MKISSLLSINEDASVQQEHALLSLLIKAGKEIEDDIDYDYSDGAMEAHKGEFMNGKSSLFDEFGKRLADASEILDFAEKEKVELFVAGFDGNWEEAYIPPNNPEIVVRKSTKPGMFIITFRGSKFELTKEEGEKVFAQFNDTELFKYKRIGDRKPVSWDDGDVDGGTPAYLWRRARNKWMSRDTSYDDDRDLDESDYKFHDEAMYGALIFKNLHHH